MNGPRVEIEDQLFRRLLQDKLDQLQVGEMKQAAEMLADSLVEARAALKWLVFQKYGPAGTGAENQETPRTAR